MFIIPIQELNEMVKYNQSTNDEAELQEQLRTDDVDEEERDDPPDWEKWQ